MNDHYIIGLSLQLIEEYKGIGITVYLGGVRGKYGLEMGMGIWRGIEEGMGGRGNRLIAFVRMCVCSNNS